MKFKVLAVLCIFLSGAINAQEGDIAFGLLRQNDDLSLLTHHDPKNLYLKGKYIPLGPDGILSFGGSWRTQFESFVNEQFEHVTDQDNLWFLNRFMFHAHMKVKDRFEVFAELNSSVPASKDEPSPVDKDELSMNQLFVRYHFNRNWNFLIGRQNMRLGSGRLVDIREGPNVRLSFDMVQLQYQESNSNVLGFFTIPVQQKEGVFDNDYLKNKEVLSGLYWTQIWTENTNTDFYVLYKTEKDKTWNSGTADDNRVSMGLRHFGVWKGLNYNNEFVYQFGKFGDRNINAWTISFNVEKEFSFGTIGLKTEAISGNSEDTSSLNTFDGLYPRGAYFGRVARIGPSNLMDVHPYYDFKLGEFNVELDYVGFWRFSRNDGVYNPPLALEYPSTNPERFIGHQLGGILAYEVNGHINLELESNIIFPGAFLKESGLADTLYHIVFTAEIKF